MDDYTLIDTDFDTFIRIGLETWEWEVDTHPGEWEDE